MKRISYITVLILIAASCFAQQNPFYNQYIFNELVINPAYAGTKQIINANAILSKQWAGVDGSPMTQTVSVEGPVSEKVGVGLQLINDKIGAQSHQGLFGIYSYKINVNEKYKVSFGLAAGASYFSLDGTKLTTTSPDDPAVPKTSEHKLYLDSKAGIFLYSERLYAGFSISDLFSDVFNRDPFFVKQSRHYYLTTGYLFDLSPTLKFKPSFLFKHIYKSPSNIDLNAYLLYNQRFWFGATYRFGSVIFGNKRIDNTLKSRDAIVLMLDYNVTEKFRLGYAYTVTTSALKNFSGHEISLSYFIPRMEPVKKMNNIRYF